MAGKTCCMQDTAGGAYDIHHHSFCKSCAEAVEDNFLYDWEDKARELFQTGCKHCHAVRMVRAVSTKFLEAMDRPDRIVRDEDLLYINLLCLDSVLLQSTPGRACLQRHWQ